MIRLIPDCWRKIAVTPTIEQISDGWSVTGFNSFGGPSSSFEIASPFTPKTNSHLSQVRAITFGRLRKSFFWQTETLPNSLDIPSNYWMDDKFDVATLNDISGLLHPDCVSVTKEKPPRYRAT